MFGGINRAFRSIGTRVNFTTTRVKEFFKKINQIKPPIPKTVLKNMLSSLSRKKNKTQPLSSETKSGSSVPQSALAESTTTTSAPQSSRAGSTTTTSAPQGSLVDNVLSSSEDIEVPSQHPRESTGYTRELEVFAEAVIETKNDQSITSAVHAFMDEVRDSPDNQDMTASQFLQFKKSICEIAGVSFKKMHPIYAAKRDHSPQLNHEYQLYGDITATVQGVPNASGKMYTSLDRKAEGATNLHRRQVGKHSWHTAGVCAAYAHSTVPLDKASDKQKSNFLHKYASFSQKMRAAGMEENDINEILINIVGKGHIGDSEISSLANSDAFLTSCIRVFEVLERMVEEGDNGKILWQRIMAPDVVRSAISRGSLNGNNERLMAHIELNILKVFQGKTIHGKKLDISFINTPINEKAYETLTKDAVLDEAGDNTKRKLVEELEKKYTESKGSPEERKKYGALLKLSREEGRFAKSVFIFAAANTLEYNVMVGCKSAKDRTGFFNAIATLVLLEIERNSEAGENSDPSFTFISDILSGNLNMDQWKKLVILTSPHMFDLPEFNQGLVGLKAGNALNEMWECYNSQLSSPENGTKAKVFLLMMLLKGSGGPDKLLGWIKNDDPENPFSHEEAEAALNHLYGLLNGSNSLMEIDDSTLDDCLNNYPGFKALLEGLDGKNIAKEWMKGASYAGV